jgi:hypothetical protein
LKTKSLTSGLILYFISSLIAFSQSADNYNIMLNNDRIEYSNDTLVQETDLLNDSTINQKITYSNDSISIDSLTYQQDTSANKRPEGESILKDKVEYNASDSTIYSIDGKTVY